MMRKRLAALAALPALLSASPAAAQSIIDRCAAELCKARLTPSQLLGEVQTLVAAKRYAEAKPMIAALAAIPELKFQTRFLSGFVAEQTGDYAAAEATFRAILVDDPKQTRVRLELGRVLLAQGKTASADHELRLSANDPDLPIEIVRTIRAARNVIRSKRAWTLNLDFGLAPDSNINDATAADSVTVMFGSVPLPLSLSDDARARSGTGVTASVDAGLRLPVAKDTSLLVDFDAAGTDYHGKEFDDYSFEAAAGPEFKLSDRLRVHVEAVGAERFYGGPVVSTQIGAKGGVQLDIGSSQRIGVQLDMRHTDALFDHDYDGWQSGFYATYEHVVAKSMIASGTVFVRRDSLVSPAYSDTEIGGLIGIGGELPAGINFGVSGGVSRAVYDEPFYFFSSDPRHDWRFNARATLGLRSIRVLGFSPEASVSYISNGSSITYYQTDRVRCRFTLARYF